MEQIVKKYFEKISEFKKQKTNSIQVKKLLQKEFDILRLTAQKREEINEVFKKYNLSLTKSTSNEVADWLSVDTQDFITISINTDKPLIISEIKEVEKPKVQKEVKKADKKLNVVSQKNDLQKLLQKHYGIIEIEKKFDWLKTPNQDNLPKEYLQIVKALSEYRNQNGFREKSHKLPCDIVLEDYKLIIEYDENQHFTKARQISLENYPDNVKLDFSKNEWINACKKLNAKDNNPFDRDERRAFYDAVRDIEAFKNGYKLIRIKHGDVDWEGHNAKQDLEKLIPLSADKTGKKKHKIARFVVTAKQYDKNNKPIFEELERFVEKFILSEYQKHTYEFILTPGGFLKFDFPIKLRANLDILDAETNKIQDFQKEAQKVIVKFFNDLKPTTFKKLKEIADYFTIGIDASNPSNYQHIELVAVFDLKKECVINWTGKFYPTEYQKNDLIKINDLNTHFMEINNQKVIILGCHDLSVFNPRGQANANPNGWKKQIADKFKNMLTDFKPDIILQHPHTTDTLKIWNSSWNVVEKQITSVEHFASGINYSNNEERVRVELGKVLKSTKKGDVIDFYLDEKSNMVKR